MQERNLLMLLSALALLPPLLFLVWVRNTERHQREPLGAVLGLFVHGGTLGIGMAILLNSFFVADGSSLLWAAVFVAPLVEELAKGLGLAFVRRRINEVEDGIVYGAAVGLGFAATETFLYAFYTLGEHGAASAVSVAIARVFSSMLLHAGSSALLGLGVSLALVRGGSMVRVLPFYAIAVGVHALYNYLVIGQTWTGFFAAIAMVIVLAFGMRAQVKRLDARSHHAPR